MLHPRSILSLIVPRFGVRKDRARARAAMLSQGNGMMASSLAKLHMRSNTVDGSPTVSLPQSQPHLNQHTPNFARVISSICQRLLALALTKQLLCSTYESLQARAFVEGA